MTMGDSKSSEIRLGIAISAFSVSATSQAKSRLSVAPKKTAMVHRMRNGFSLMVPTRNSQHFSE